eukprot:GHRR01004603.1.p1 GENE.GHRR01004603.1~~GHRR01004603.1.p1  ORF type:complete len:429 (+),score=134.48 GHRR01004603.1:188-1474(+)
MHSPDDDYLQTKRPFNVSTKRFGSPASLLNTNPGPGNYSSNHLSSWQAGSVGHKGYGALASSSTRLTSRIAYTGPGPGNYSPLQPNSKHSTSRSACTAPFHKPLQLARTTESTPGSSSTSQNSTTAQAVGTGTLGPGAYSNPKTSYTATDWRPPNRLGATAAFRTPSRAGSPAWPSWSRQLQQQHSTARCGSAPNSLNGGQLGHSLPAEGLAADRRLPYEHIRPGQGSASSIGKLNNEVTARMAASASSRVGITSAELASRISAAVFGSARCRPSVARTLAAPHAHSLFNAAANNEVPGPGSYEMSRVRAISSAMHYEAGAGHLSPAFRQPLVVDRFGTSSLQRPIARQLLVPQQSATTNKARMPKQSVSQPGVSAPFRSHSPGHIFPTSSSVNGAPGPAFYHPEKPSAKVSYRYATSDAAGRFLAAV